MTNHCYPSNPDAQHDEHQFIFDLRGHSLRFTTDAGVFSRDRIDYGSVLLMETTELPQAAKVLDVGCGYGPIGLTAAKLAKLGWVTMIDVNERAVELARRNAAQNGIANVTIEASDLFEKVQNKKFDIILTNPPIRAGKETVHRIFVEGHQLLEENGEMWVVIQKKQGAPSALKKLQETYREVEEVERSRGYFIYRALK